ncbi:MAG: NTP transferase domain-containing protein [Syntrophomonadaceae bacterium]|nr:NTP transferase domain-containing protein [Syntrophomonadaceae bacterium]
MKAVILAGGKGLRLWPESTDKRPKQLCDFLGEGSLLMMTIRRLSSLGELVVVCGEEQLSLITEEIGDLPIEILAEPIGRNTAPAVGLVLATGSYSDDEVIGVFPADHYIKDDVEFVKVIKEAEILAKEGYLVTVGITPNRAETGYGYIEKDNNSSCIVKAFHEKPDRKTAEKYISSGNFFWNAGIFIATARVWRSLIKENLPEVYKYINEGAETYLAAYDDFPNISIDYGIAEKCSKMAVVQGNFGWSDIGSWDALAEVIGKDEAGNTIDGDALAIDCVNCFAKSNKKKLVLFGLNDLVVVETEDTILVCPKDRSQDIKELVDKVLNRDNKAV